MSIHAEQSEQKSKKQRKRKPPMLNTEELSGLQKAVADIANSHAEGYDDGIKGFIKDLHYGGCQSGLVGELIYSADCKAFFSEHMDDIFELYENLCNDMGQAVLPRDNMPLSADWFAWLAFEETAFNLAREQGFDED
jgi:hypothetical protein